ncbi:2,4-dienoyl-CoA reductase [Alicyclobacillus cycloheptanicus]|nr:2,4-dienoyl-CoA reductase [Alicyclobacillus cycloheptanicus]
MGGSRLTTPSTNAHRVALITGGSSGIGEAFALRFLQTGGSVAIVGRSEERLNAACDRLKQACNLSSEAADARLAAFPADVRDADRADEVVEAVFARFGKLDVLVNNAAGNFPVKAEDLSTNGWNAVVQIVLNGTFFYSRAYGRKLIKRQQPGVIVNVVATYAWTGGPLVVHSASAKAGVVAMTKTLAVEWAPYGIRVNAIAPGPIEDTGGAEHLWPSEEVKAQVLRSIPAGRLGTKEEVARAMDWLASADNSYLTGDILVLDGGRSLGHSSFRPVPKDAANGGGE